MIIVLWNRYTYQLMSGIIRENFLNFTYYYVNISHSL